MLDTTLIERALKLTGKEIDNVCENTEDSAFELAFGNWQAVFSIEKFCYYLMSPEFISKIDTSANWSHLETIGFKICSYQEGNPKPLEELLSKI